jgi:hypothetical protein
MLKLGAIDFQNRARVSDEGLGSCLDEAGFASPRGSQEQKVSNRTARARHAGEERLIDIHDLVDSVFLPDHQLSQIPLKLFRFMSRL